jgi:hypothetical protein
VKIADGFAFATTFTGCHRQGKVVLLRVLHDLQRVRRADLGAKAAQRAFIGVGDGGKQTMDGGQWTVCKNRHLRQKVEKDPENPRYIHNERGFGYRFGE